MHHSSLSQLPSEWAQVLPAIRAAQLAGFLDGTKMTPPKTIEVIKGDKSVATTPNPEQMTPKSGPKQNSHSRQKEEEGRQLAARVVGAGDGRPGGGWRWRPAACGGLAIAAPAVVGGCGAVQGGEEGEGRG
uniref:Uncharacterized protein n=1 Tax=Oryza punctata TaxID=4537 RepID=A0A0E0JJQ4_ORYPU